MGITDILMDDYNLWTASEDGYVRKYSFEDVQNYLSLTTINNSNDVPFEIFNVFEDLKGIHRKIPTSL